MIHSIRTILLKWFLAIALIPLAILGAYVYQKVLDTQIQTQNERLEIIASLHLGILKERFFHTQQDLNVWAKNKEYAHLLDELGKEWKESHLPLGQYVKSASFNTSSTTQSAKRLVSTKNDYKYVYDLFLIDTKGNILFTVAQEADLGENLFYGSLEQTRFARAVRATLEDKKDHFSDLERYAPSNKALSGFFTTPILDEKGKMVGVMAMQFEVESLMEALSKNDVKSYLVGTDGLLRSAINNNAEVLTRPINTQQFWRWYNEHGVLGKSKEGKKANAFIYQGVDGTEVIGTYNAFDVLSVRWALISEVDKDVALARLYTMISAIGLWLLLVAFAVSVLAFILSKKITKPISVLADASLRYVRGEKSIRVVVDEKSEFGQLGDMFNQVMGTLEESEARLIGLAQVQAHTLQELEEQKKALDAHAIVSITNEYGIILYANEKFSAISGYSNDELIGQNHRILNSGFHSDDFWKKMYDVIELGQIWHHEVCNRASDGHLYWVDATIVPLMDEQGRPKRYIAIRTDISARKNAEMVISEKEGSLQTLLNSVAEGIYGVDVNGFCTFVNHSMLRILGYDNESELLGKHIHETIHHSHADGSLYSSTECKMYLANQTHVPSHVDDEVFWKKDGTSVAVEYWSYPMVREGVFVGAVATFLDITERRAVEAQLIEAKERAENSSKAKADFLATMSHEIRTPMNGVLGMLGLLERSDLDASQVHQVKIASSSATSLLSLINDILDFSKIEAGKMEVEMRECNIHEILQDFYESMVFKFEEKNLGFVVNVDALPQTSVITDSGRLRQILTNLVGNAVKFTHHGEVRLVASLEKREERGILHFDVHDSGIGIDAKRLTDLFNPFVQADSSTTRKYGGTGLGLSIVKKLCELMNGTLNVSSVVGEGSVFSVTLDVALGHDTDDIDNTKDTNDTNIINTWNEKTRILLVEDNATNQMVALGMLDALGLEADIAVNGKEALEALKLALAVLPYTVVLMDCQMPVMDGYEATVAIRRGEAGIENKNIPIIAMTANAMSSDREKCIVVGMDDFLTKPIDLEKLQRALVKWTGQKTTLEDVASVQSVDTEKSNIPSPPVSFSASQPSSANSLLWDRDGTLSRLGGREALLEKIVESFVSDAPIMMSSLEEAIKTHNLEAAQLHAHSLKGSSANIGAVALAEISKLLENAAREGNIVRIKEKIGECEQVLGDTLMVLRQAPNPLNNPVQKLHRLDPIAMMMELQELIEKLEMGLYVDTGESKLFEPYNNEDFTRIMKGLKKSIEHFEYDDAKEAVAHAMETLE